MHESPDRPVLARRQTIGKAVEMRENTMRKYILQLEERELIVTRSSGRRNGNLLFTPARFRR